jgi:hypothetical protein
MLHSRTGAALNAARSAPLSAEEIEFLYRVASLQVDQQKQVLDLIERLVNQDSDSKTGLAK